MPRILICGDPHGEFGHIIAAVESDRPDAVVLLGDIEAKRPLHVELAPIVGHTEIFFITGNHDTDSPENYDNLFSSDLSTGCIDSRIVDVSGVLLAGFGGVFRKKIWEPGKGPGAFYSSTEFIEKCGRGNLWREGLPLRHRSTIFPSDFAAFSDGMSQAHVLVTHEAPDLHACGYGAISVLAEALGVQYAFHGHHHEDTAYSDSIWRGVGMRSTYLLNC